MKNLPIVIELHTDAGVKWLLSFGGSNPTDDECIELSKEQCFWLSDKIKSIAPSPLG